jgi:hypothetical protein
LIKASPFLLFFEEQIMSKIYAGVGARKTPQAVLNVMTEGAKQLDSQGWALRSGHADGADYAFEQGSTRSEIHLPWDTYNRPLKRMAGATYVIPKVTAEVAAIAEAHHAAWDRLSDTVKSFMYRNVTIVLGLEAGNPADMLVCWTPDGIVTGGTGHAIRVAHAHQIPVFNLYRSDHIEALDDFISKA